MTEYEEREAAVFALIPWPEYLAMDRIERAGIVAHMRVHNMVESHRNDAVGAEVKRRSEQASKGNTPGRAPRGTFDDTFRGGRDQLRR